MTVIRVVHNKENPFVQLNKQALRNEKLSLKAIGLWARCMSRPDDWRFNVSEMASNGKEGKRSIYSAIDELIEEGYAIRLEHYEKKKDGKFNGGGVEYIFFEFPVTDKEKLKYQEEFKKCFRQSGYGDRRCGDVRNAPLQIQKETDTDLNQEESSDSPSLRSEKSSSSLSPTKHEESKSPKEEMRRRISCSDQIFEEAWNRYLDQEPGEVRHLESWLAKVVIGLERDAKLLGGKEDRVSKHKKQSESKEVRDGLFSIVACSKHVEICSGSNVQCVAYDVPDREWKEKTGWS